MGKTDPTADGHRQQSQIPVPRDTPGIVVKRAMTIFGYEDHDDGGHGEIEFNNVRVPVSNIIGWRGDGPDEVHRNALTRNELKRQRTRRGARAAAAAAKA